MQYRGIPLAIFLGLSVPLATTGCGVEGADYEKELVLKSDGLVYRLSEDRPYTGSAYVSVCGSECRCGLFGPLAVHWQGEYKHGKKHGTFAYPVSRRKDDFYCAGDSRVIRVRFSDGIEQPVIIN